jgi:hypothetical protein
MRRRNGAARVVAGERRMAEEAISRVAISVAAILVAPTSAAVADRISAALPGSAEERVSQGLRYGRRAARLSEHDDRLRFTADRALPSPAAPR